MKRQVLSSILISLVLLAVALFTSSRQTNVSGQAQSSRGWRVWVRTSPCSGRFDWLSVAKDFPPPQGGGLNTYVPYETLIAVPPRPELACTDSTERGCTFAEAEALREKLRFNSKFFSFCCHDYSVWSKDETKETDVFLVRVGTPGLGWRLVKADLCCEEAEALAGKPGVCSGGSKREGGNVFGPINQNAGLNGKALKFYGATTPEACQSDCDRNPQCNGFTFIRAGAYSPTDPKMCYLMSEATSYAPSPCCISGIKEKKQTGERPAGKTYSLAAISVYRNGQDLLGSIKQPKSEMFDSSVRSFEFSYDQVSQTSSDCPGQRYADQVKGWLDVEIPSTVTPGQPVTLKVTTRGQWSRDCVPPGYDTSVELMAQALDPAARREWANANAFGRGPNQGSVTSTITYTNRLVPMSFGDGVTVPKYQNAVTLFGNGHIWFGKKSIEISVTFIYQ